jgi:hypothetical protein
MQSVTRSPTLACFLFFSGNGRERFPYSESCPDLIDNLLKLISKENASMSQKKRSHFTNEQKAEAIRIDTASDKLIGQDATEMDLTQSALANQIIEAVDLLHVHSVCWVGSIGTTPTRLPIRSSIFPMFFPKWAKIGH